MLKTLLAELKQDPYKYPGLVGLVWMVLITPFFSWYQPVQSLKGCDESYYALIARQMLETGNWIGPTLLGDVLFEKPPLLPWLIALSYRWGGLEVWTTRLPSILAALACIPLTGWIGQHFISKRATVLGLMVLPLCFLWVQEGRMVGQDLPLTLLELIGIATFLLGLQGYPLAFGVIGITFGLGLLMKSAMIFLAGAAFIPILILHYQQWIRSISFWAGLMVGGGICGFWLALAFQRYGVEVVWTGLVGKVQDLGATPFHPANNGLYYLWHLPTHGFPWTLLGFLGAWILIRQRPLKTLLIWSFPLILLLELEIFPTRTHYYTLQLYPWLALLAGVVLDQWMRQDPSDEGLFKGLAWGFSGLGVLLVILGSLISYQLPGLEELQPHGLALILIGLLYSAWMVLWLRRRHYPHVGRVGVSLLIGASLITLQSVVTRSDFGNFNPALARFDWTLLPATARVDIGSSGLVDVCQALAHGFYTPHPGHWVHDQDLQSGHYGSYLWISPTQWETYGSDLLDLDSLAELEGWHLMARQTSLNS